MQVTVDISSVARRVEHRLGLLDNPEMVYREACVTLVAVMRQRIFERGENSNGTKIGTYSSAYLRQRKKQGWGGDDRVILVATDQMRGDLTAIGLGDGYGVGFNNRFNFDKMRWNEERYGQNIGLPTDSELQLAVRIVSNRVNSILNDGF